jgi:hypothetical protein
MKFRILLKLNSVNSIWPFFKIVINYRIIPPEEFEIPAPPSTVLSVLNGPVPLSVECPEGGRLVFEVVRVYNYALGRQRLEGYGWMDLNRYSDGEWEVPLCRPRGANDTTRGWFYPFVDLASACVSRDRPATETSDSTVTISVILE